jgi:hypothetical protein
METAYAAILAHEPGHFICLHHLGLIANARGEHAAAARLIEQAISIKLDYIEALIQSRRDSSFAPRLPSPEHLARHRLADLFLDTLPYDAHTTASDALWAGLPVLTCAGDTFAGRVAGSLLHAAGLSDLVAHSPAAYESLALRLAREPALLQGLRQKLLGNRLNSPLFDIGRYTRHYEAALIQTWETWAIPNARLAAAHRLLRRDGVLFLSIPNMDNMVWRLLHANSVNP